MLEYRNQLFVAIFSNLHPQRFTPECTAATWQLYHSDYYYYYNHLLQPFNGLFSRTTWVSRYQKGKTNLNFTGARDSEWQWHQLGNMQVCTSLQTDNHASTPPLCFLQARCPSCHPTNSVKALITTQDLNEQVSQTLA